MPTSISLRNLTVAAGLFAAVAACAPVPPPHGPGATASTVAVPRPGSTAVDADIAVYADCRTPTVKPAGMVWSCADANDALSDLRWTSWTDTRATAVGTYSYNDCQPNCASGQMHTVAGTNVTLTGPVPDADGRMVWSELQLDPLPPGYATGPFAGGPVPLPTGSI